MAGRLFDAARAAQGFASQEALDAFYRERDHAESCPVCSSVGGAVEVDDGMQPVMGQCAEGLRLTEAYWAVQYARS